MQRRLQPEFSATEAQDVTEISGRERAKRLALFLSTIRESPDAYRVLIGKFAQVEDVLKQAVHPEVMEYGLKPDDHESFPYTVRAIHITGEVLRHGDDLEAMPDPETAEAMRNALAAERRKNPDVSARVVRLGALAGQISLYETLQTPDVLYDFNTVHEHSGTVYENPLDQADIA